MKLRSLTVVMLAAGLLGGAAAYAQQQPAAPTAPPDLNAIPDKMPFNTPYGSPITHGRAQVQMSAFDPKATWASHSYCLAKWR